MPISTASAPNYARSSNDFSQTIGCKTYEQPDQRLGIGPLPGCSHAPLPGWKYLPKGSERGEEDASNKSMTEL